MNIEQLTKTQIILLTLLVSFVTSIATGIVTVTLIDQAPPAVTQTINRVVERTVERVVATDGKTTGATDTAAKEVRVILKENDLITGAVAAVDESVVRIYTLKKNDRGRDTLGQFIGLGFVVSSDGLVVTDRVLISQGNSYMVSTKEDTIFRATLKDKKDKFPTAIIKLSSMDGSDVALTAISFANVAALKLGETVVTLYGKDRTKVATGIVSDIVSTKQEKDGKDIKVVTKINTSINDKLVSVGSPIVDLLGQVAGIYVVSDKSTARASYVPITVVAGQLKGILDANGGS